MTTCTPQSHDLLRADFARWSKLERQSYAPDGEGWYLDLRQCPECGSTLARPAETVVLTCSQCAGSGFVEGQQFGQEYRERCDMCTGDGITIIDRSRK